MPTRSLAPTTVAAVVTACAILGQTAPAPPGEWRTVPLESCYATFGGSGCTIVRGGDTDPYGPALQRVLSQAPGGASNLVLVRGGDIAAALRATRVAFTGGISADAPAPPDPSVKGAPRRLWLVAYLGTGSSSGVFRVHAVAARGQTVRLTYSRLRPSPLVADAHPYLIWVPLGEANPAAYSLELYDADRREVMLLRRVVVAEP